MSFHRDNGSGFWDFLIVLAIVYTAVTARWESLFVLGGLFILGIATLAWKIHRDKIQDRKLMKRAAEAHKIQDEFQTARELRLASRTTREVEYDRKHPEFSKFV